MTDKKEAGDSRPEQSNARYSELLIPVGRLGHVDISQQRGENLE
jgi:hypothetical protein